MVSREDIGIVNIFLAISYDMNYKVWKSNRKALLCVSRLQSALRQFLEDPLGSRDFRENAVTMINVRTMSNNNGIVGTKDNRVEHACASELDLRGGLTRRNISNDQENEEIILSINTIPIEAWA